MGIVRALDRGNSLWRFPDGSFRLQPVRMLIFLMAAMAAFVIAYALGLGGAVSSVIFLFILFNGVLDRFVQPILQKIRP